MAEFPYTHSPKNVTEFFGKIRTISVPSKVTLDYLKSIQFKSSYDQRLPNVLKALGFLSADRSPTERWQNYRSEAKAGLVMAQAIRETYSGLFGTYADAYKKDDAAIKDYLKAQTQVADSVVDLMLKTFKDLCALADFGATPVVAPVSEPAVHLPTKEEAARIPTVTPGLTVNINIQLTLPATDDKSIYDKLFASLKMNLLS